MILAEELERVEAIAADSLYAAGVNSRTVEYSFEIFRRYLHGGRVLEMGAAEGVMTEHLVRLPIEMTIVEGSARFCDDLRRRYPRCEVVHSLFEEYEPEQRFDAIILGHVLEHVADPVAILSQARGWLAPGGCIMAAVPNCRSLHRQAAVIMGMLETEDQLNEMDRHHGHRRVYGPETFRRDFLAAGLDIEVFGGYWLKPVSNGQIEKDWSEEMLRAFMKLGERYPDVAGELYIVAR